MTYSSRGLGVYRERRINISSDNFIVAGAIKTTGKDPKRARRSNFKELSNWRKLGNLYPTSYPEAGKEVKISVKL